MKNFLILSIFIFFICSSSYGQRVLLSQGFENGPWTADSLPQKWAKVKVISSTCSTGPTADWRARDSGEAFCGTNAINGFLSQAFNSKRGLSIPWTSGNGNNTDEWVFTDSLRIATGDSLIFWSQLGTSPGGTATYYIDSLQVWVTSGQTPASQISRLGTVKSLPAAANVWQNFKFDLSAYNGQKVYVAFRYYMNTSVDGIMVNVDSVMVRNLSATPPVGTCNFSWNTQTSGTTSLLYTVSAVSDQIGWAAGAAATVRRTTDGGTTWGNGNSTPGVINGDIYNIYAWSANDALVTTSPGATFIYKTSNGGTTWTQVYTLAGGFMDGIQMISATEGYAYGDPVGGKWVILKTTDGGATWARMATEPVQVASEAGYNNAFYILGTNMWFGTSSTKIYHSTDLGLTWTSGATTGTANSFSVHYNTTLNGLVGGSAMVKSVDGGTTYTSATAPGASGSLDGLEGNGTDWWSIRTGTDVYRSTNQGSTWTTAYTVTGASLNDIDFTTPIGGCPSGWVVAGNGSIAKMTGLLVGISSNYSGEVPSSYLLKQNYPNPFNPTTNISFSIPKSSYVSIKVYDLVGKEVATLVNETKSAGNYIVGFNAGNLPSGTYFYRIESNNFVDTKKMILVK